MTRSDSHLPRLAIGILVVALGLPTAARAANSCNILTTGAVSFGTYLWTNPSPTDSAGAISYNCNSAAAVFLSGGNSGSAAQRTLSSGTNTLAYNLYSDAARTQIWGDFFTGGSIQVVQSGRSSLSVYGRIPAGQNVAPGAYTDTVTVSFLF